MNFGEARRAYRKLGQEYFAGKLSRADYRSEVRGLRVTDDKGRSWRIDSETGTWQRLENGNWKTDDPDGVLDEFEPTVAEDLLTRDEAEIPPEIVGGVAVVILAMLAAASLVYLTLNAMR